MFLRPDREDTGRGTALWLWFGTPSWTPAPGYASALSKPQCSPHNPGKKRVWVPDEQDAYVEAEVKSEASGGRVSVETKDQKVCLPLFPFSLC